METDRDFALALQLQEQYDEECSPVLVESPVNRFPYPETASAPKIPRKDHQKENAHSSCSLSVVDESWELVDPNPDVHSLFLQFNDAFFWGKLDGIEVRWSPRMTTCAGLCCYEGRGGLCSVRLSEPLLKLRPRRDLVQTLLHEMIHAYLFVTDNNKDHDGHGPEFHKHMYRINKMTGANVTVYHTFHDEVRLYKQHWWRCNGPCQNRQPYFGYVKRASNRAPAPHDFWWEQHQKTCGGQFVKVKEPKDYKGKGAKGSKTASPQKKSPRAEGADIRTFFKKSPTENNSQPKQSNVHTKAEGANIRTFLKKFPTESDSQPKMSNVHTISSVKTSNSDTKKSSTVTLFGGSGHVLGKRKS